MAKLPYLTAYGGITKALDGIKTAAVPERVSQDFVKEMLKIPGGSGDKMTAFLKKLGFSDASGKPTQLYTQFRNPTTSGHAMAVAIRQTYAPLYRRNEYMHTLSDADLTGLIIEETGEAHDSNIVKLTLSTINKLKEYAVFDRSQTQRDLTEHDARSEREAPQDQAQSAAFQKGHPSSNTKTGFGLNLGYTINLNLPASTDPAVFNAIFKALKEHLLDPSDA